MSNKTIPWHKNFIKYMEEIVNHENYKGLSFVRKADGTPAWVATEKSEIGQKRVQWAQNMALKLGIENKPGVYAKVMLEIHPTKSKVCQTCGLEMSLYYHYPNRNLLKRLEKEFGVSFEHTDHIEDVWDDLILEGNDNRTLAKFFIDYTKIKLNYKTATKTKIIEKIEFESRSGNITTLGPGAMSNFPDRYDGFHTYNRCCRSKFDKGRSKENLKSYNRDRRAYEYWSDGNIHGANKFMNSNFFEGVSADHIGPISLGFVHDSLYLKPMSSGDNSAKRDRLLKEDIELLIEIENRTKTDAISWFSKEIWKYIKNNYKSNTNKINNEYRNALKLNMSNFMHIIGEILLKTDEKGMDFLSDNFIESKSIFFKYDYIFDKFGNIVSKTPRNFTARNINEFERFRRIAFESATDFNTKNNRNIKENLSSKEAKLLDDIINMIIENFDNKEIIGKLESLISTIQIRIIKSL